MGLPFRLPFWLLTVALITASCTPEIVGVKRSIASKGAVGTSPSSPAPTVNDQTFSLLDNEFASFTLTGSASSNQALTYTLLTRPRPDVSAMA